MCLKVDEEKPKVAKDSAPEIQTRYKVVTKNDQGTFSLFYSHFWQKGWNKADIGIGIEIDNYPQPRKMTVNNCIHVFVNEKDAKDFIEREAQMRSYIIRQRIVMPVKCHREDLIGVGEFYHNAPWSNNHGIAFASEAYSKVFVEELDGN